MEVVDHGPHAWFLLRDGDEMYLDVRCSRSFVDFSILLRLTPAERAAYQESGHAYADTLANAVSYSPDRYFDRDHAQEFGTRVTAAVVAWRAVNEKQSVT